MFVFDTNILVYAADEASPFHEQCKEVVERFRSQQTAWFISWGIVYEFLRVVTHPSVFRKPWSIDEAWLFISALLASPSIRILTETERHAAVLGQMVKDMPFMAGNLVHDGHTAVLMAEHGVTKIFTRDADFNRFSEIEVVDPTRIAAAPR